jgi:hypothetical protein
LEDQNVSNDSLGPISDAEAASLQPAFQLAQKVTEVVKAIHRQLPEIFGNDVGAKLRWKAEGELLNAVGAGFRQTGELFGIGNALRYGLTARDGTAYWTVTVQPVGISKVFVDVARNRAEEADFDKKEWERPASGGPILIARTRATAIDSHEAAANWFKKRLTELAGSHVMDALLGFSADMASHQTIPARTPESPANEIGTDFRAPDGATS